MAPSFADIRCANCNAPVGEQVDEASAVVRCGCGTVLDLGPFVLARREQLTSASDTAVVPRPLEVDVLGRGHLRLRSFPWRLYLSVLPAVIFLTASLATVAHGNWRWPGTLAAGLILTVPWVMGALLGYARTVRVAGDWLSVRTYPLPLTEVRVPIGTVRRLEVGQTVDTSRNGSLRWYLVARTPVSDVKLLKSETDPLVCLFVKQQLERLLPKLEGRP